jgi:pimeloyl-ACP methyl ester carboxylesterase
VEGDGDPIVLLNGMHRSLESWDPFVSALSRRTVVRFDVSGAGEGSWPNRPVSIAALADLTVAVLDEVGVDRADVVGFSHGGAVAQEMARRHPSRVGRLVLVSTSCGLGSTPSHPYEWATTGARPAVSASNLLSAFWHLMALSTWSSIPFLGSLAHPTLVVCGTEDIVAPPANSRALAARIPDATLVLLPGGHDLQNPDAAEALARAVDGFLKGTAVPAGAPEI